MRIGDLIECCNERDLKQTMSDLELGGFNADRMGSLTLELRKSPKQSILLNATGFLLTHIVGQRKRQRKFLRKESKIVSKFVF